MIHDELRGLIPILALDALSAGEEAELISHVKICRECSELLASYQKSAGSLGLWALPVEPPVALRERILRQTAESPRFTPGRAPKERKTQRSSATIGLRVAAAASVAAVLTFGGFAASELNQSNDRIVQQAQTLAEQSKALDLASADSTIVLPVSPAESYRGVKGNVFLSGETNAAAVLMTGLDDPGDNVYTLWLTTHQGARQNVAEFKPDESGLAVVNLNASVHSRDTLAVTLEPHPGATRPTGPVVGSAYRTPANNPLEIA